MGRLTNHNCQWRPSPVDQRLRQSRQSRDHTDESAGYETIVTSILRDPLSGSLFPQPYRITGPKYTQRAVYVPPIPQRQTIFNRKKEPSTGKKLLVIVVGGIVVTIIALSGCFGDSDVNYKEIDPADCGGNNTTTQYTTTSYEEYGYVFGINNENIVDAGKGVQFDVPEGSREISGKVDILRNSPRHERDFDLYVYAPDGRCLFQDHHYGEPIEFEIGQKIIKKYPSGEYHLGVTGWCGGGSYLAEVKVDHPVLT